VHRHGDPGDQKRAVRRNSYRKANPAVHSTPKRTSAAPLTPEGSIESPAIRMCKDTNGGVPAPLLSRWDLSGVGLHAAESLMDVPLGRGRRGGGKEGGGRLMIVFVVILVLVVIFECGDTCGVSVSNVVFFLRGQIEIGSLPDTRRGATSHPPSPPPGRDDVAEDGAVAADDRRRCVVAARLDPQHTPPLWVAAQGVLQAGDAMIFPPPPPPAPTRGGAVGSPRHQGPRRFVCMAEPTGGGRGGTRLPMR